jgi:hypothetical protein
VALFGKKKTDEDGGKDKAAGSAGVASAQPARDPRKARPWFDRAKTVADAQNYDYAIECYISGLQFEPERLEAHEALRDVSLKRRVHGGKPAGWSSKSPVRGRSHVEKMLESEFAFSMDPANAAAGLKVMEEAMQASEEEDVDLYEVVFWIGQNVIEANRGAKRPAKSIYLKVRDIYATMEAYGKAAEACAFALQLDPNNAQLIREMRDLQAETTMQRGGYGGEEGGFRKGLVDQDKQRQFQQESQIAKTDQVKDQVIARLRAEYEDQPEDTQRLDKLVRALRDKEQKASEDEAIKLLNEAWERTGQYRYKMQIGDVRMKQFSRALRETKKKADAAPDDARIREQLQRIAAAQLKFELDEYAERVKNYPTDMGLRYQLGRRQLAFQQYDEAIASLQQARSDPKHRSSASIHLGQAFARKEWFNEAIDTFRAGLEEHSDRGDKVGLELSYCLMDALEQKTRREDDSQAAEEALHIASQIAQTSINFKDIRQRVEQLKNLVRQVKDE